MIARRGYKEPLNLPSPPGRQHNAPPVIIPNIDLPEGVSVTGTSLNFPEDFAIDDWTAFGRTLCALGQGIQFWSGDWWHYGFHAYGERKAKLNGKEAFKYSFGTLMNWGSVAGKVPTSGRREALSFSHHVEVAPLPAEDQEKWLKKAEREKLTVKGLRRKMYEAREIPKKSDYELAWDYAYRLEKAGESWASIAWAGIETELISHLGSHGLRDLARKCDATSKWWAEARETLRKLADAVEKKEKAFAAEPTTEEPTTEPNPEQEQETDAKNKKPSKHVKSRQRKRETTD